MRPASVEWVTFASHPPIGHLEPPQGVIGSCDSAGGDSQQDIAKVLLGASTPAWQRTGHVATMSAAPMKHVAMSCRCSRRIKKRSVDAKALAP